MILRRRNIFLATAFIGLLISPVRTVAAPPSDGEPLRLTVLVTNDVRGYLEPCG